MRSRLAASIVCVLGAALLGQTRPTAPPPQSTFRGGVHVVRVDMYASRDGVPITDLGAEEVEVLEDGKPQTIRAFEHVSVPLGGPEATRVEPNSIRASQQMAADPRARVFVLFLDSYHMDAQTAQQARVPVRQFLEEALGPDDLVAVATPEMAVGDLTFTRRTTVISGLLGKTEEWLIRDRSATTQILPLDATERMYYRCYPEPKEMILRRREKLTLDFLNDLSLHLGSIRDERKTVLVVTLGWKLYGPNPSLAERKSSSGPPPLAPIDRLRGGRGRDGIDGPPESEQVACDSDRVALANLDNRERMREITGDANRANVSFYPVTPLRNPAFSEAGGLLQLSTLREMAADTDGMAIVDTNNIAEPMRRVVADMSSYYLLGYESTNTKLDGRFRTIKVSVKRPNVTVRARKGYRAVSAADVSAAAAAAPRPDSPRPDDSIASALNSAAGAVTPVPLRLRASAWTPPSAAASGGMLWVTGELDARTRREPGWASGGAAEITVTGSPDAPAIRSRVTLAPGASVFAVRLPEVGTVAPGRYDVRVSLRPAGPGDSVSDRVTVTIPDTAIALGEAMLLRRGPATGTRYLDTASLLFARSERLRLELPTASSVAASARVVDRAGQTTQVPAQVSTRSDAASGVQWVIVDVTLAPFAPGDYAVVVTQDGATQVVGFRVTP